MKDRDSPLRGAAHTPTPTPTPTPESRRLPLATIRSLNSHVLVPAPRPGWLGGGPCSSSWAPARAPAAHGPRVCWYVCYATRGSRTCGTCGATHDTRVTPASIRRLSALYLGPGGPSTHPLRCTPPTCTPPTLHTPYAAHPYPLKGLNIPWNDFGYDIGGGSFDEAWFYDYFKAAAANKSNVCVAQAHRARPALPLHAPPACPARPARLPARAHWRRPCLTLFAGAASSCVQGTPVGSLRRPCRTGLRRSDGGGDRPH